MQTARTTKKTIIHGIASTRHGARMEYVVLARLRFARYSASSTSRRYPGLDTKMQRCQGNDRDLPEKTSEHIKNGQQGKKNDSQLQGIQSCNTVSTLPRISDVYLLRGLKEEPLQPFLPPLSKEQAQVLEAVKSGANVFFTGPAGSGKSLILSHIKNYLHDRKIPYDLTAPTGVAACLLGGQTIHSWAGVGKGDRPVWSYAKNSRVLGEAERFRSLKVLMIDEVSMLSPDLFIKLNQLMKKLRIRKDLFMGGMQLIVTGDFYQLPPVSIESSRTCNECGTLIDYRTQRKFLPEDDSRVKELDSYLESVGVSASEWTTCSRTHPRTGVICGYMWNPEMTYAFQTLAWAEAKFRTITLTKVHRQTEQEWVDILGKLKLGRGFEDGKISTVLSSLQRPLPTLPTGIIPTMLYTHRNSVASENERAYGQLLGNAVLQQKASDYGAHVEGQEENTWKVLRHLEQKDIINEPFWKNVAARDIVALKPKTQVMLLINLNPHSGLVNGSRGIVTGFRRFTLLELATCPNNKRQQRMEKDQLRMIFPKQHGDDPNEVSIPIPLVTFIPPKSVSNSVEADYFSDIPIMPHVFEQVIRQPAGYSLRLVRVQFPLDWAWALTIHKCQGMSLDYAIIDIEKTFLPGQAYVALSRVRSTSGLQIQGNYKTWHNIFKADRAVHFFHEYLESKKSEDQRP